MDDTIVALCLDDGWQLARVAEGSLHTLARLPIPASAVVRRDGEGRWWALVQQQEMQFAEERGAGLRQHEVWTVEGFAWEGASLRPLGARRLPLGVIPKDVTADARWLFVGGEKVPSLRGAVLVEAFPEGARRARWWPLDAAG